MIKTRNIAISYKDINSEWAFQHLLGLTQPLEGGDTKIISPLTNEKSASFCIYKTPSGLYKFKDFSSSEQGDAFDLLVQLQALKGITIDRRQALDILKKAYNEGGETNSYIEDNKPARNGKGKVVSWELRRWEDIDLKYWGKYDVDIPLLEHYNVAPVHKYTMEKLVEGELKTYIFEENKAYGFFYCDGSLHSIYRPGKKPKSIRVITKYLLGTDQIIKPAKFLIYMKSLKEGLAFKKMGFSDYDFKAVDAEGILVSKEQIEADKKVYKKLFVWLDPDSAGLRFREKYKLTYDLDAIDFNLGPKDLTDGIDYSNSTIVKLHLMQILL